MLVSALFCEPPILGGDLEEEKAYSHPLHISGFNEWTANRGWSPNWCVVFNGRFAESELLYVETWLSEHAISNYWASIAGEIIFEDHVDAMLCYLTFV